MIIWLTGLSSAGKTTIGRAVCDHLAELGRRVELLDGDVIRRHLCKDLGFTKQDRNENIRRIGFVAGLLARHGVIVVVSAISPYRAARDEMRRKLPGFIEVYVNASLDVCARRDVKGLYQRALRGELTAFTGINDPYEPPLDPEVECCTDCEAISESVQKVLAAVEALSANLGAQQTGACQSRALIPCGQTLRGR